MISSLTKQKQNIFFFCKKSTRKVGGGHVRSGCRGCKSVKNSFLIGFHVAKAFAATALHWKAVRQCRRTGSWRRKCKVGHRCANRSRVFSWSASLLRKQIVTNHLHNVNVERVLVLWIWKQMKNEKSVDETLDGVTSTKKWRLNSTCPVSNFFT